MSFGIHRSLAWVGKRTAFLRVVEDFFIGSAYALALPESRDSLGEIPSVVGRRAADAGESHCFEFHVWEEEASRERKEPQTRHRPGALSWGSLDASSGGGELPDGGCPFAS